MIPAERGGMAAEIFVDETERRVRSFAFFLAVLLCVLLSGCFAVLFFLRSGRQLAIEVDSKVNLNDEPVGSLVRLPGIGPGRAAAIVDYRENSGQANKQAFKTAADLEQVEGIGPKTKEAVERYLKSE